MKRLKNRVVRWLNNRFDSFINFAFTLTIASGIALTVFFALMSYCPRS